MTFAAWWAVKYASTGEVPEEYFDLMRDAYEHGKIDEREACAKVLRDKNDELAARSYPPPKILLELEASILERSNVK